MDKVDNRWMDIALAFVEKHTEGAVMKTADQMVMVTKLAALLEHTHSVGVDAGEHVECDGCDTCDVSEAKFWLGDTVHAYQQHHVEQYRREVWKVIGLEYQETNDEGAEDFLYTLQNVTYSGEILVISQSDDTWFMKFAAI